jgi:hypothetical protein
MSGYKKTIQELKPAGFWSFDGEPYDPTSRLFTHSPLTIYDEGDQASDAILLVGAEHPERAYRAGMASLVGLELAQQQSVSFGHYGVFDASIPKAVVQIPHRQAFENEQNYGSFCWQFLLNKVSDETAFRSSTHGQPWRYSDHPRHILHKPAQLTVVVNDRYSSPDIVTITFPNGAVSIETNSIPKFYNSTHHIVCNWEVRGTASGYEGTATVYIDGMVYHQKTTSYADVFPVTSVNQPAELAGRSDAAFPHDRCTSATYLDAIAFWNRALRPVEVYRLFKKIWQYVDMVKKKAPVLMVNMQDEESVSSTDIYMDAGSGLQCRHSGQVTRHRPGPPNVPGSRSMLFSDAMVNIRATTNYQSPQPVSLDRNNYAIEFWVSPATAERAVLMSMQNAEVPFAGPLIELNVNASGQWANGCIAFTESNGIAVSTPSGSFFNDGAWHHVVAQRRGEFMELFVDGKLMVSERKALGPFLGFPSDIKLMGVAPGRLSCPGGMSYFAMYSGRTFTEYEVSSRHSYSIIYRVRGNTTLRGIPYRARVRLYDYITGELIDEMDSATTDGLFQFYLKDNSLVNAFVAAMNDQNVRVRAFGPLVPAEIQDP